MHTATAGAAETESGSSDHDCERGGAVDAATYLHDWVREHRRFENVVYREFWVPSSPFLSDPFWRQMGLCMREDILVSFRSSILIYALRPTLTRARRSSCALDGRYSSEAACRRRCSIRSSRTPSGSSWRRGRLSTSGVSTCTRRGNILNRARSCGRLSPSRCSVLCP